MSFLFLETGQPASMLHVNKNKYQNRTTSPVMRDRKFSVVLTFDVLIIIKRRSRLLGDLVECKWTLYQEPKKKRKMWRLNQFSSPNPSMCVKL